MAADEDIDKIIYDYKGHQKNKSDVYFVQHSS